MTVGELGTWISAAGVVVNVAIVLFLAPAVAKSRDAEARSRKTEAQILLLRYQVTLLMRHAGIDTPTDPPPLDTTTLSL